VRQSVQVASLRDRFVAKVKRHNDIQETMSDGFQGDLVRFFREWHRCHVLIPVTVGLETSMRIPSEYEREEAQRMLLSKGLCKGLGKGKGKGEGCDLLVFLGKQLTHEYDLVGPCAALRDGASCVVNHAEYIWAPFTKLCMDLRKSLAHVYANSYVTPPGTQAVPAHADDRDVFIVQLCGCKQWRL